MFSDKCIRPVLLSELRSRYDNCSNTSIFEEFSIPRPSARIDVAVVNGSISGFEIKSDLDTLSRLKFQIPAYECYFEEMTLVTTAKHIDSSRIAIPARWGIKVFSKTDTSYAIEHVRHPKKRIRLCLSSQLHSLHMSELKCIIRNSSKRTTPSPKACKEELVDFLIKTQTRSFLRGSILQALKSRFSPHNQRKH